MQLLLSSAPEPDPFSDIGPDEAPATPASTREAFLTRASRGYVPIRRSFLWTDKGPGPLHRLVTMRSAVPLDLLLLRLALQTVANVDEIPFQAWSRMLGQAERPATESATTRALTRLANLKLAAPGPRNGHSRTIELRSENGADQPYTAPSDGTGNGYFQLPFDYWLTPTPNGQPPFIEFTAPGKAVLLILLSETSGRPSTPITVAAMKDRYGISTSTGDRGLRELSKAGLLLVKPQRLASTQSATGYIYVHHRALATPYSTSHRQSLRTLANEAVKRKGGEPPDHE